MKAEPRHKLTQLGCRKAGTRARNGAGGGALMRSCLLACLERAGVGWEVLGKACKLSLIFEGASGAHPATLVPTTSKPLSWKAPST